jgi:hypothetical protein
MSDGIRERGRYYDIIVEALVDYDGWMLDDDYDATPVLNRIMKRMRERLEMSDPPQPATAAQGPTDCGVSEATEDDIAAVIVAAQTSNSSICAAALQQKFVITRRGASRPARTREIDRAANPFIYYLKRLREKFPGSPSDTIIVAGPYNLTYSHSHRLIV